MTDERNWFDNFALSLENHKRGVQYGAYSMAVVGLAVALKSVRPFKRFTAPSQIPAHFIERQMRLSGHVLRVEPSSGAGPTTLIVNHFPVISFGRSANDGLPVHIASVELSSNGISWLQHVVVGKDVNFTLLKAHPHSVSCIVHHQKRNIGGELVSLGLGSVAPIEWSLQKNPAYLKYYKALLVAEKKAERQGAGMWHGENNGYMLVNKVTQTLKKPAKAVYQMLKDQITKSRFARLGNI